MSAHDLRHVRAIHRCPAGGWGHRAAAHVAGADLLDRGRGTDRLVELARFPGTSVRRWVGGFDALVTNQCRGHAIGKPALVMAEIRVTEPTLRQHELDATPETRRPSRRQQPSVTRQLGHSQESRQRVVRGSPRSRQPLLAGRSSAESRTQRGMCVLCPLVSLPMSAADPGAW